MPRYTFEFVGNVDKGAVECPELADVGDRIVVLPSWADDLRARGVRWLEGPPSPTQECSAAELIAKNKVGLTLIYTELK